MSVNTSTVTTRAQTFGQRLKLVTNVLVIEVILEKNAAVEYAQKIQSVNALIFLESANASLIGRGMSVQSQEKVSDLI